MVQWLALGVITAEGLGSVPSQGLRSRNHMAWPKKGHGQS